MSVFALTVGGAGAACAQDGAQLEEIVVTAQKRAEPAMQVPISLTALSGAKLQQLGVRDLVDLAGYVPGLVVQEQSVNNPGYQIRGVTSDNTNAYEEPRVSIFQDGVSISKAQASYVELFDMDRVEVARGPQSTLYGRSALIGGVNLIQHKATLDGFDGYLHAEGGELNYVMGEGAVNVPVNDTLAVRLAGRVRKRDGYVDNALGGDALQSIDSWALRGSVKYAPNDRLNVDIIGNYQKDTPTGTAFKSRSYLPSNPGTGQVVGNLNPWDAAAIAAPADFENGRGLGEWRKVGGVTALVDFKLADALTLHSITAWRGYNSSDRFDADGTSLNVLTVASDSRGDQWSQELRLNYDDGGRLRGFVGGSFFRNSDNQRIPLQFDERESLAQLTGRLGGPALGLPANTLPPASVFSSTAFTGPLMRGLVFQQSGGRVLLSQAQAAAIAGNLVPNHAEQAMLTSQVTDVDLFGDVSFKVTERLELTGGLRYTHERQVTGYGASVADLSDLGAAIGAAQIASAGTPAALAQANAILGALTLPKAQQAAFLPLFGLFDQPTTHNGDISTGRTKDNGFAWRLAARYEVSDDANVYATYARGRRPPVEGTGGPNAPGGTPFFGAVPAETVDSYEVGAKGAFLDKRLMADVAAYAYHYRHFQTIVPQGGRFVTIDAGRANAYGLETQVAWRPVDSLELDGTYAFSHARFKNGAFAGNHFRLAPDNSFSLVAVWTAPTPVFGGVLKVQPSYTWQSRVFFADNNDRPDLQQPPNVFVADNVQDELQKSYGLANLRASWSPPGGHATFEVFATNLFDRKYVIDAGNTGDYFGLPTFIAGPPRVVGVGVDYRF